MTLLSKFVFEEFYKGTRVREKFSYLLVPQKSTI